MATRPTERLVEDALLPHLDAAYNLARWLTRSAEDADDVVQEAFLRALRFSAGFRGGDPRAWLLAIVRNASYDWLRGRGSAELATPFDEAIHGRDERQSTQEMRLIQEVDLEQVRLEIEALPLAWREVLILREFEELSYKEIAGVVGIPLGTVMSRLSRARARLQERLTALQPGKESTREVR